MQIGPGEIHVWLENLALSPFRENASLLSQEEDARAQRLQSPIHKQRFIAARCVLRQIISLYTQTSPQELVFLQGEEGKPFLQFPAHISLQFNISHSADMAVYAFTALKQVGVDIERIRENYNPATAQRFFSSQENAALQSLPAAERRNAFYRIWARKEAVIKTLGKGLLSLPLPSFSVSIDNEAEIITLDGQTTLSLLPLSLPISIDRDYQAAVASNQAITQLSCWELIEQSPKLIKVYDL
jgi:4'-phosphopantetheinyl transferase